jgi:hypothetical protein
MKTKAVLFFYLLLLNGTAFGQTELSGKVIDEKGLGLPGVNIFIKGSYDGATSNVDGNYKFSSKETEIQIIVFRFLGFKTKELAVVLSDRTQELPTITLIEAITEMNAVIASISVIVGNS